jgi:signal recognition particle receptor subunit beta
VAAHRPSDFRLARRILAFMNQRAQIPVLIGLTHMDCEGAWSVENVAIALGFLDEKDRPPFVTLNANQKESVVNALIVLIEHFMQSSVM